MMVASIDWSDLLNFSDRNPHFKVSGSSTHNKVSTSLYIDYDDDIVSVLFVVTIGVLPLKVHQWIVGYFWQRGWG